MIKIYNHLPKGGSRFPFRSSPHTTTLSDYDLILDLDLDRDQDTPEIRWICISPAEPREALSAPAALSDAEDLCRVLAEGPG